MESDPIFVSFVTNRMRVLEGLDASRSEVDAWIESHRSLSAGITELARFEGLLAARRDLLAKLLKLDDDLLDHLISMRGKKA